MRFSISSLLITLLVSCILILFLSILLMHKNNYKLFRTDFLMVLVIVIVLRMILPIEWFFTKTIKLQFIMNPIINWMEYSVYGNIQLYHILIVIWIVGIVVNSIKWIKQIYNAKDVFQRIEISSKVCCIRDVLVDYTGKNYLVYTSSLIYSPMVMGFKEVIMMPDVDFSKEESKNILIHEAQHIRNKDIYIKQIINLLVIIYWWFLPVYMFQKEFNLFLEMRVDHQITKNLNKVDMFSYMKTLVHVQEVIKKKTFDNSLANFMMDDDKNVLSYRIQYLMEGTYKKKTNKLFMMVVFLLPFLSNCIIFESHFDIPKNEDYYEQSDIDHGYIIEYEDGTYEMVIGKEHIKIDSVEDFKNLPIVKK